jgi:REP element-mobilizing transposase RayT
MPRTARRDAPGVVHHVMMRGIERRRIFRDEADRQDWVDRMGRLVPAHRARCFAWVLMPNHVHLVLQTGATRLSGIMARLNTGYAKGFNLRHQRTGYLFENRFKSRVVANDSDLLNLIRYVYLNPVRARTVPSWHALRRYPWSGYGALVGTRSSLPFEDVDFVLGCFGGSRTGARRRLKRWIEGSSEGSDEALELGETVTAAPEATRVGVSDTLDVMIRGVCRNFGIDAVDLRSSRRAKGLSTARAVIAFLAVARLGASGAQVAARVGLSRSGVSRAIERGAEICSRERGG